MSHGVFDRIWALALHDKLTHARITFTKPRYTSANARERVVLERRGGMRGARLGRFDALSVDD